MAMWAGWGSFSPCTWVASEKMIKEKEMTSKIELCVQLIKEQKPNSKCKKMKKEERRKECHVVPECNGLRLRGKWEVWAGRHL